jgi:predicted permease
MDSHLDLHIADLMQAGLSREHARRRAILALGGAEQIKEQHRSRRGVPVLTSVGRDLRQAVRGLRASPVFATTVVVTLALTIGAGAAVFSLLDRVLLRPLDAHDVTNLVTVQHTFEARGARIRRVSLTWEQAQRVREMSAFESLALSTSSLDRASQRLQVAVEGIDADITADARFISADYFRVLGVPLALGRDFGPSDDTPAAAPAAVVSHRFWRRHLGGRADAIGGLIRVNGTATNVIGVVPASFTGTDLAAAPPDLYLPLTSGPRLAAPGLPHNDGQGMFTGNFTGAQPSAISPVRDLVVVGRLKAGADAQARALVSSLSSTGEWAIVPLVETVLPVDSRADLRRLLTLLAVAVGLTLLIGCANVAGLLLVRAEERESEFSVRAALGAGRGRLVQLVAAETAVLGMAGGLLAPFVAQTIGRALSAFVLPGGVEVSALREGYDLRTIAFTLGVTFVSACVIGVGPAWRVARHRAPDIRMRGVPARLRTASVLLGLQVGICLVLVVGAALFIQSIRAALATDLGFNPDGLISLSVSVAAATPGPSLDGLHAVDGLVARARTLAGVAAATAGPLPVVRGSDISHRQILIDGRLTSPPSPVDMVYTAPDYFRTLGQTVVRGREFGDADRAGTRPVAVVNEAAARQFWPDADALDRTVAFPPSSTAFAVVGVARDVKLKDLRETGRPVVYLPRLQHQFYLAGFMSGSGGAALIVRAVDDPNRVRRDLDRLASEAGISLHAATTLDEGVAALLMPQRLGRALFLLLGTLALALALVGVHGLAACIIARQRKELGVRIALGASAPDVVGAVWRRALVPVLAGAALGSFAAWWSGGAADRFLYGLSGSDPTTIGAAVVAIVAAAMAATILPTRRALRIDPAEVLRRD